MVDLREGVTSVYGPRTAEILGFVGDTPDDPRRLLHLARHFLEQVVTTTLLRPRLRSVQFDLLAEAARVEAACGPLAAALGVVTREEREAEATRLRKNAALDAFDEEYAATADYLAGVFSRAGDKALADRVRPPTPRRAGEEAEPVVAEPVVAEPEGE